MLALTVKPRTANSARLDEVPEPDRSLGDVLIQAHTVGVCGTDRDIIGGEHGAPPPDDKRLILGHESLGRVLEAPAGSGLSKGDWVVGIVRHPDPVPCASCAHDEWDMCENGRYAEHGIKELHGFAAERYRLEPRFVVRIDPTLAERGILVEPASIVAKAWDQIDRIARRAFWAPRRVLVIGGGPIGLLAALLGVQRGFDVHVFDRHTDGPKPQLVADLDATYHAESLEAAGSADIILECTGVPDLILAAMYAARPNGIVCLIGVSAAGRKIPVDAGGLSRELVLENNVVFGSVNANRAHYEQGALALQRADPSWLDRLITRRVPLADWARGLEHRPGDVKTVLTFSGSSQ